VGGIAIEGEGRGASTIASISWVKTAPNVFYWGDMDQDGLEILNEYRTAALDVCSLFMSLSAYERYRHLGTNEDIDGNSIKVHPPRPVNELKPAEAALYQLFANGAPVRRIEQERIPLSVAHDALCTSISGEAAPTPSAP
jgi:hypothetical protein